MIDRICTWRYNGGFTLIEVLIALIIGAVVVLALAASMSIAFDGRDTVNAAIDHTQARLVVWRTMRADLEQALPPTGGLATTFAGENEYRDGRDADRLMFDTTIDSRTQRVVYELARTDDDDDVLVRSVQGGLLADVEPAPQMLVRGVERLNFRYYDGTDWFDNWDATLQGGAIPVAVEMSCQFTYAGDRVNGEDASVNDRRGGDEAKRSGHTVRMLEVFRLPLAESGLADAITRGNNTQATQGGGGGEGGGR